MEGSLSTFPTIHAAIRAGANLWWEREPARGVWARTAWLGWQDKRVLAVGIGVSIPAALAAAEDDLRAGGPIARELDTDPCGVHAMNALHPVGSADAVSILDAHLRDDGCVVRVDWEGEQFRLAVKWVREAKNSKAERLAIIAEGVPVRYQHGEYIWEVTPHQFVRGKRQGKWYVDIKPILRPPKGRIYPHEPRLVSVAGMTIDEMLVAIEEPLGLALAEDREWMGRIRRCS